MFKIKVEQYLVTDIEAVFKALADHENYDQFPVIDQSELVTGGSTEREGLDALRRLTIKGAVFDERIIAFEPPHKLGYRIESASPIPFDHDFGMIELEAVDGGTKVTWTSEGRVAVPLLGRLFLNALAQHKGTQGFKRILSHIEANATDSAPKPA